MSTSYGPSLTSGKIIRIDWQQMPIKVPSPFNKLVSLEREMPVSKLMKQMRCNYEDVGTCNEFIAIIELKRVHTSPKQILEEDHFSMARLKESIGSDANEYIHEMEAAKQLAYNNALR
jgi:hypothetical protein